MKLREAAGRKYPGELIGKEIKVVRSTNKNEIGMAGVITDESKSTLKLRQGEKTKTLLKKNISFVLPGLLPAGRERLICGREIAQRPEERIKS